MKNKIFILLLLISNVLFAQQRAFPCYWSGEGTPPDSKSTWCNYVYHTTSDTIWYWDGVEYLVKQPVGVVGDGDGIYSGDGTIPSPTTAYLSSNGVFGIINQSENLSFEINDNLNYIKLFYDSYFIELNNSNVNIEAESINLTGAFFGSGSLNVDDLGVYLQAGSATTFLDLNNSSNVGGEKAELRSGASILNMNNTSTTLNTGFFNLLGNTSNAGRIRLSELSTNGSNYIQISSPNSLANDLTFVLPNTYGTNGQLLTTDGSGTTSWTTITPTTNLTVSGSSPILLESSSGSDINIINSASSVTFSRRSTDSLVLIQLKPVYTSLISLDSAINSTSQIIVIDTEVTVTAGLDFPTTKHLIFVPGGKLIFNNATISDFFCSIEADDYQNIFQFNVAPSTCINPGTKHRKVSVCWFGAISGDGLDDSQAGNYATEFLDLVNDASTAKGTVLYYPAGEFNNYGTVKIWSFMTVTGAGMNSTTVHGAKNNTQSILESSPVGHAATYSRSSIFRIGDWTQGVEHVTIKDMYLQGYYGIVTDGPQTAIMADIGYLTKEQYHRNIRLENLHCDSVQMICTFYRAGGREFPDETTWFRHKKIEILNNIIEYSGNKAIEVQEGEDIIITGNIIKGGQDGIQFIHSCRRGIISNNRVDFEDTGIAIANGGEEITVSDNVVYWTGLGLDPLNEPNGFGGALHMKWDNYIAGSPGGTNSEPVFNVVITNNVFDVTASSTNAIRSMAWHWGTGWTTASVTKVKIANNIFRHRSDAIHALSPHVRPTTTTWDDVEFIGNSFYAGTFSDINQSTTGQVRLIDNYIEGNATFNQLDSMIIKDNIFDGTVTIASGSVGNILKDNIIRNTLTISAATSNINSQLPTVETSTTGTINWLYRNTHNVQLDFATGSSETVTMSKPLSGATYTLVCRNMGATPTITWATQPVYPDGTNVPSNIVQTKPVLIFYYNGTNYILIN